MFAVRVFHHIFVTVVLGLWLILRLIRRRGLPPTPLNPLLYLCVIVWFVSALTSLDPRMALENLWFPLTHLLIFFVLVDVLQSGRESLLVETQFLLAALVAILAAMQLGSWLFGWGFATPSVGWLDVLGGDIRLPLVPPRLYVPLGVSTWLAAYTAPLAVLAFAWGASARQRAARNALWLLAAFLVIIMLLTNSRGGWISLGAGAAVFAVLQLARNDRLRQFVRRYALPLGAGLVAIIAVAALTLIALSSEGGHAAGDVLRFDLWRGAVEIASEHPALGVGPGMFGRAYRLTRDPRYVDNRLGTAHNFYLNSLSETGIVGALVALALGALLVRTWWRLWHGASSGADSGAESPTRRLHLEGALAALVGFGAQSFFDTFTSIPLVLLALGLAAYCVTDIRLRTAPPLPGSRPAAAISLVLLLGFGIGLPRSDQAQAAFNASVNDHSLEQAQQAAALDPSLRLYSLQITYLTEGDAAIPAYQNALALEPTWDTGWINLAALYEREGDTSQTLDALQHAIDIDNHNGAFLLWARVAEDANAAPPETIVDTYLRFLRSLDAGRLPLSSFWSQTDLRRQALDAYAETMPLDLRYRIFAVHDPARKASLAPANPVSAADWWVVGEYALEQGDAAAADAAFTQAIDHLGDMTYGGDYYTSRARARVTLDPAGARRDLDLADLLGTYNESPNAVRARLAAADASPDAQRRLWGAAVPPRIIDQNFEGVLFAGRVASFDALPEMRLPGPGRPVLQPWYDLAESYLSTGETDRALNVYHAILDRAPEETDAFDQINHLAGGGS